MYLWFFFPYVLIKIRSWWEKHSHTSKIQDDLYLYFKQKHYRISWKGHYFKLKLTEKCKIVTIEQMDMKSFRENFF